MYILHASNEFVSRVFAFKMQKKKRKKRINQTCFVRFPLFSMKSYIFLPYKSSLTAKYESINFHRFGGGSETINNFREKKKKDKIEMGYSLICHVSKFIKTANCKIIPDDIIVILNDK